MMKNSLMIRLLLPLALTATPLAAQQTALAPGETLLEVQAEGQARLVPDQATITVGVVSTGVTAREATGGNARAMTAVIAAIRRAGVGEREVRTQQINVSPRFARSRSDDDEGQPQISGYVARNAVVVTVRRLATAPDVVAAAFGAGANSVYGPTLATADPQLGQAAALHLRDLRLLRVSERSASASGGDDIVVTGNRLQRVPIIPGEQEVTVTVWIDYAARR